MHKRYYIKKDKLKRLERMFKADIKWAVEQGIGFMPSAGAMWTSKGWRTYPMCNGTCAVGALVIRRNTPDVVCDDPMDKDYCSAAKFLCVSSEWMNQVYKLVMQEDYFTMVGGETTHPQALELARKLRKYGDELMQKRFERQMEASS